jgi:uncharacterized glyoxalase superfamily protein PhnB
MGKETTEKVRRWREQQRVQGRRSLTLWLEGETVERLHTRAQTLGVTVPDLIVRMVTDTVTATTENEVTDTITVTSLTPTGTLRQAIRDELGHALTQVADTLTATVRETVQHALSEVTVTVTDTTTKVTDTVTDTKAEVTDTVAVIRELVREEVERALHQATKPGVTVTQPKVTDTVTDTKAKVTDTVTDTTRKARALTAEGLANAAMSLHQQGLSYEQIARQWDTEGIPTLKGGQWHKGTVYNLVQRHQRR